MDKIALKEWAAAIWALEEGRQIVLMRKGGIVEETKEFRLESSSFLLYPTYEHQRRELLKEEAHCSLDESLRGWSSDVKEAEVACFAEAVADLEVTSQEQLDRIRDHHIWTDQFAEERLKWKKLKPLHVLLLRVYKLDRPLRVPILDEYAGCKSWIRLQHSGPIGGMTPVLPDDRFERLQSDIERLLTF